MEQTAQWISAGTASPFYARRSFFISKAVERAEAEVCGLGQFEFHVNGRKIGDHELDPGWTAYNKYIQYVRFDVTDELRPGENVLGAEVGNGWFLKNDEHYTFAFPPFMPPNPNPYRPFGKSLVLAIELRIEYADGSTETITADGKWKTAAHEIVQSNVYGSETFDGSLRQHGWDAPGFDDSGWTAAQIVLPEDAPKGLLREQRQPPVKVLRSYEGRLLHRTGGRAVYDFGQNMSGILELSARGRPGAVIRVYPAEKLDPEGNADQMARGWTMVDSLITVRLGPEPGPQRFRMKFSYFAGRYAAVEAEEGAELLELKAHAISSAWKRAGSFDCDDDRLNRIYDMIEKTAEANLLSVHTDCPSIDR
ncbi:MAG: family 78 glycoside hydrolase catalytic domain, partial [Oscillospiraceae bacterium]|nr:family 78 glycoside hydrolase catalytic domain [Oscillospiraceae bacterium]